MGCRCRRDSRGCESREIDPEQPGTEACLTQPDRNPPVSSFGTRVGADRSLSRAPGAQPKKNYCAGILRRVYSAGCWELKWKFPLRISDGGRGRVVEVLRAEPRLCGRLGGQQERNS